MKSSHHVTHRQAIRATTLLATVMVGMFLAFVATATASNQGFSFTPSKTEPFAVCGNPKPGHAACFAIIVPTASSKRLAHPGVATSAEPSYEGGGVGGGFDPANLQSAYNLPSGSSGSGQTVAIVDAYDDPNAESDLAKYRSHYGLSACTTENGCFKKVNQKGEASYPSPNASWAVEISLDLDMVSASCPHCHILLVEATTNSYGNLLTAEDEAATLGATEISNSWGGEEFSGETSYDEYFHHPGVDIAASAGDHGYEVEYPAASHDVIAVGGTALTKASNTRGWSETAWSGTGSGCSAYEPKPLWQHDSGCKDRTNNDVSAVASTETPVSIADSYELPAGFFEVEPGWTLVGGTSVSSPLIAGTMALAGSTAKELPGAEAFYDQAEENGTGVLDDVVSGKNGSCGNYLCEAGPGYDGPTGLGSPYGVPIAPAVATTTEATNQYETQAALNGTVNPNGQEAKYFFQYGTSTSYGSSTAEGSTGSGSTPVPETATITGLQTGITYHYRVAAKTGGHISYGQDSTFTLVEEASSRWAVQAASTKYQWVYYPSKESAIWDWSWNGTEWLDSKLGSEVASGANLAVTREPNTNYQWVYYVGKESAIRYRSWNGAEWFDTKLGGEVAPDTSPTVARDPSLKYQWVYYVGKESAIWYWSWNGSEWKDSKIGGEVAAGTSPTVIRDPNTKYQWVYYVGKESALWDLSWNGSEWKDSKIGGEVAAGTSPTAVGDPSTKYQWVYYVNKSAAIWDWTWNTSTWSNGKVGGEVAADSSPTVIRDPSLKYQWVYYVDKGLDLRYLSWNGSEWQSSELGGEVAADTSPTVVRDPGSKYQWVYYVGKESAMWYWSWNTSKWADSKLGGEVGL